MKILIDNGHGSNTPGKCSPDGRLREYSYTREIAGRVVFELRKLGIDAELVVKEEIDVPLSERCRRVNEYKTSEAILISIHCNAAGNGQIGCKHVVGKHGPVWDRQKPISWLTVCILLLKNVCLE